MFYEHIILAKKGPLARVWLAAHWDKKITKAHVFETNIEKSVEGILQPKVKLALRTSGHLLLGVVRIYSKKAKYLLADCNEAFVKIKMAFRPGMVDLPEGHREANVNAITLPEVFHDFDTALPELNDIDIEAQFTINQSRADEITMREDYGSLSLSIHDDGFGDIGFDNETPDIMRGSLEADLNDHLLDDNPDLHDPNGAAITLNEADLANTQIDDGEGFGDAFGQPELFEDDLFGEPPAIDIHPPKDAIAALAAAEESDAEDNNDHFDDRAPSPHSSCKDYQEALNNEENNVNNNENEDQKNDEENEQDQSTLIHNEDESFALAPVDATAYKGVTKAKRKRKLIVDDVKNISGEEMKAQLANTSDIVTTLDLAPPTKRLMYWKETGGVEKLFSLPSRCISARVLFANYNRHLFSHFSHLEDFSCLGPVDVLALDHLQNENDSLMQHKRGRKRKNDLPLSEIENNTEVISQSLSVPEVVRDQNNITSISQMSLEVVDQQESFTPVANATLLENVQSPAPVFPLGEVSALDNLNSLNDVPFTPGNVNIGIDNSDDFHHGDQTPAGLNHGHMMTPRRESVDNFETHHNQQEQYKSNVALNESDNVNDATLVPNKSFEIESDWNEFDFGNTSGVQTTGVEQMENETDEQFEERVLNKRAAQMFYALKSRMDSTKQEVLLLSHFTFKNSRKQAAQKFYSLLVLKKVKAINITQSTAYADILIERGPAFENPKL